MSDVNKMIFIGRLGQEPELKTVGQSQVCQFSIATNEKWKDKDGQLQERVEWTTCVVWGKPAEVCAKYLKKGHSVYVEGRKRTRTWDKDGVKHSAVECVVDQFTFLNNKDAKDPPPEDMDRSTSNRGHDADIPY